MKDRSGGGYTGRGIDPLVDQSTLKDQYAPEMQGLRPGMRERGETDGGRERR